MLSLFLPPSAFPYRGGGGGALGGPGGGGGGGRDEPELPELRELPDDLRCPLRRLLAMRIELP
jgi:hypothetical protein